MRISKMKYWTNKKVHIHLALQLQQQQLLPLWKLPTTSITDLNCPNWGSKLGCQNSRHLSMLWLLGWLRRGLLLPLENRSPSFMLHFCETGLFISKLLFLSTALQHYKNWWATTITGNTQYLEALGLLLLSYFIFSGGWEVTFQY